jgi:hypothetical protein
LRAVRKFCTVLQAFAMTLQVSTAVHPIQS